MCNLFLKSRFHSSPGKVERLLFLLPNASSYSVHTSLLELPHRLLIPPTPLKKGGKKFSKSPNLSGDLGGSTTILVFLEELCVHRRTLVGKGVRVKLHTTLNTFLAYQLDRWSSPLESPSKSSLALR